MRTILVALASLYVAAGGVIHLREWLDVYRHVPAGVPGAAVVRVGFPVDAAISLVLVLTLVLVRRRTRLTRATIVGALAFEALSLATLIATRTGSVFGWSEPAWTLAAKQTLAVEIGALVALGVLGAMSWRPTLPAERGSDIPTSRRLPAVRSRVGVLDAVGPNDRGGAQSTTVPST